MEGKDELILIGGMAALGYALLGGKAAITPPTPPVPPQPIPEGVSISSAYPSKSVVSPGERFKLYVNLSNKSGAEVEVTVGFGPSINIPPQTKTLQINTNTTFIFDATAESDVQTSTISFPVYLNGTQTTTTITVTVEGGHVPPTPPTTKRDIRVLVKGETGSIFGVKQYSPLPGAEVAITQGDAEYTKTTGQDGYTDYFSVNTTGRVDIYITKSGYEDGNYYLDPETFPGDTAVCEVDKEEVPQTINFYAKVVTRTVWQVPVANARVDVIQDNHSDTKYTDSNGFVGPFTISPNKGCTVMVIASGYEQYLDTLTASEASSHQSQWNRYVAEITKEQVVREVKHIQTKVVDADTKAPIADANVMVFQEGEPSQSKKTRATGYTDPFEIVIGKNATFLIGKQGYDIQQHTYNLDDWDESKAILFSLEKST